MAVIKTVTIPSPGTSMVKKATLQISDWNSILYMDSTYYYADITHNFNADDFIIDAYIIRDNNVRGEQIMIGNKPVSLNVLRVFWNEPEHMQVNLLKLTNPNDFVGIGNC